MITYKCVHETTRRGNHRNSVGSYVTNSNGPTPFDCLSSTASKHRHIRLKHKLKGNKATDVGQGNEIGSQHVIVSQSDLSLYGIKDDKK